MESVLLCRVHAKAYRDDVNCKNSARKFELRLFGKSEVFNDTQTVLY